jgi:hypothetical protein
VCRFIVCSTAHADRLDACSQTTGSLHWDLTVSSPRRRIDRRLRAGVAQLPQFGPDFHFF